MGEISGRELRGRRVFQAGQKIAKTLQEQLSDPANWQPYFWISSVTTVLRSNKSLHPTLQMPVVIPDRGTLVVTLDITLLLKSWKDGAKLDRIKGDMAEALKTIWKEGSEGSDPF